jgi:prepilin-type processing-associated H-X9-DG protein
MGNAMMPPNPPYANCGFAAASVGVPGNAAALGLSSYHPGGAHVALCDGSVRFLKNSISISTIWALDSRARGEVISADAF